MWARLKGVLFRRHPGGDNRHGVEHGGGELGLDRGLLHLGRRPLLGGLHGRRAARLHLRRLGNPAPAPGSSQSCHLDISGANSHNLSKVKQLEGQFFLRDYVDWLSDIQSPGSDLVLRTFIVMCNFGDMGASIDLSKFLSTNFITAVFCHPLGSLSFCTHGMPMPPVVLDCCSI